ncbi:hypothetical protein AGMMS49992_09260 [Clostridia bacterium]|nr:hypothetical protein AGMMS49992_09260 [Clostridia bacterium]
MMSTAGYAIFERVFDDQNRTILESYFDSEDKPVEPNNYFQRITQYDNINNSKLFTFRGADGHIIMQVGSDISTPGDSLTHTTALNLVEYASEIPSDAQGIYPRFTYDSELRVISFEFMSQSGDLVLWTNGYARKTMAYDYNDNRIRDSFFNGQNQPVLIPAGYAQVRREFNDNNLLTEERYYGVDGYLIRLPEGYAGFKQLYDDKNNVVEIDYLNESEQIAQSNAGYAIVRRKYDENYLLVEESYHNPDGMPTYCAKGYSIIKQTYDFHKRVDMESYYDISGEPALCIDEYASIKYEYNASGDVSRQEFYGLNGQLIETRQGYAILVSKYNLDHQLTLEMRLDEKERLVDGIDNWARSEYIYDDSGQLIQENRFSANISVDNTTWNENEILDLLADQELRSPTETVRVTVASNDLNINTSLPTDWINVLLLGTDDRDAVLEEGRSDATIIASLHPETGETKLTSIARDTFVEIPGTSIRDRINTAQHYGGPNLAMKTVNTVLDMNITKYVRLNMSSLKKIVDLLGGVTIDLDSGEGGYISIRLKGVHGPTHLNGDEALAFSRIRYLDNDFGRTNRQRRLLIAMFEEAKKDLTQQKIIELIQAILPHVTTNLTLSEIVTIGVNMLNSGLKGIETLSLPIEGSYRLAQDEGRSVLYTVFAPNVQETKRFVYGY